MNERKEMSRVVDVVTSKNGNVFLSTLDKNNKMMFVNLIKDNKKFSPKIPKSAKSAEVTFTSYLFDDENKRLVLFDVKDITFMS